MRSESKVSEVRQRRQLVTTVKESLRDLRIQLSLLNHQVGARVELKDVDLDCLSIVDRYGPLSPSALARLAGLHPATTTGILDRLERRGWAVRERDSADRRVVTVRVVPGRNTELSRHYSGMNLLVEGICSEYSDAELELVAGILHRIICATRDATDQLATG